MSITRLDLIWVFGAGAADEFTRAYAAAVPLDADLLALWDVVATFRPCGTLGQRAAGWPAVGRPDVTEATMRADHAAFLARAVAVLER